MFALLNETNTSFTWKNNELAKLYDLKFIFTQLCVIICLTYTRKELSVCLKL